MVEAHDDQGAGEAARDQGGHGQEILGRPSGQRAWSEKSERGKGKVCSLILIPWMTHDMASGDFRR